MSKIKEKLSNVEHILGLSATPERYYDPDGTKIILDYFGPIIFRYNIKDAQREEKAPGKETVLAKYDYYPYIVQLTQSEEEEVMKISKKIRKSVALTFQNEIIEDENAIPESARRLMNQRATILKKSKNKLEVIRKILMENEGSLKQCIIYCQDTEQLNEVKNILNSLNIDSYVVYTSKVYKRGDALKLFKEKNCKFILSIHCLDQGVNIPECQSIIFMSSSGNPREYIQRRGRVLRNYKGKPTVKMFDIFAFPKEVNPIYQGLVKGQLLRAWEFLDCSQTPEEKINLDKIKKMYEISDDKLDKIIADWRD